MAARRTAGEGEPGDQLGRITATTDGSRSSAATTAGEPSRWWRSGRVRPDSRRRRAGRRRAGRRLVRESTRRPRRPGLRLLGGRRGRSPRGRRAPAIAASAGSMMPGSRANSACASKIAPISSPARPAVSRARAVELVGRRASSAARSRSLLRRRDPERRCRRRTHWAPGPAAAAASQSRRPTPTPGEPAVRRAIALAIVAPLSPTPRSTPARTPRSSADDVAPGSW